MTVYEGYVGKPSAQEIAEKVGCDVETAQALLDNFTVYTPWSR